MDGWLAPLLASLRLPRPQGSLLLVRHARPGALPTLVRALLPLCSNLVVAQGLTALLSVPEGGIAVLLPMPASWDALNLQRSVISRRRLRVILWCDEEAGALLRLRAPDLADWILRGVDCPDEPPPYARFGVEALIRSGVALALVEADAYEAALRAVNQAAAPVVSAALPYVELVREISATSGPLCFTHVDSGVQLRRLRWALAQAGCGHPALVVRSRLLSGAHEMWPGLGWRPWGWTAHGLWLLAGSERSFDRALAYVGQAAQPGVLAALVGQEDAALALCEKLLAAGVTEAGLIERLVAAPDAGAELAKMALTAGLVDLTSVAQGSAPAPQLRGLWDEPQVQALRREWRGSPLPEEVGSWSAQRSATLAAPPAIDTPPRCAWYLSEALLRGAERAVPAVREWLVSTAMLAGDAQVAQSWAEEPVEVLRPRRPRGPFSKEAAMLALQAAEQRFGGEHVVVADALEQLALVEESLAPLGPYYLGMRRALAIRQEVQGPQHPDVARVKAELAAWYREAGLFPANERPESLEEQALSIWGADPRYGHERAAVLATRMARLPAAQHLPTLRQAARELRQPISGKAKLRLLIVWPPRWMVTHEIAEFIRQMARMRRWLEDGPLAGAIEVDTLIFPEDYRRPDPAAPDVLILGDPVVSLMSDELIGLFNRFAAPVRCLCIRDPSLPDEPGWWQQLSGRVQTLLAWGRRRSLAGSSALLGLGPHVGLALFCESIAAGQTVSEAIASTEQLLGRESGLRPFPRADKT